MERITLALNKPKFTFKKLKYKYLRYTKGKIFMLKIPKFITNNLCIDFSRKYLCVYEEVNK